MKRNEIEKALKRFSAKQIVELSSFIGKESWLTIPLSELLEDLLDQVENFAAVLTSENASNDADVLLKSLVDIANITMMLHDGIYEQKIEKEIIDAYQAATCGTLQDTKGRIVQG